MIIWDKSVALGDYYIMLGLAEVVCKRCLLFSQHRLSCRHVPSGIHLERSAHYRLLHAGIYWLACACTPR